MKKSLEHLKVLFGLGVNDPSVKLFRSESKAREFASEERGRLYLRDSTDPTGWSFLYGYDN